MLVRVTVPVAAAAVVGSNWRARVADCPGFRVNGKVSPDIVNPVPVIAPALTVNAAVPEEVNVTVWVEVVFRATVPKLTVVELSVSAGEAAT